MQSIDQRRRGRGEYVTEIVYRVEQGKTESHTEEAAWTLLDDQAQSIEEEEE